MSFYLNIFKTDVQNVSLFDKDVVVQDHLRQFECWYLIINGIN